MAEDVPVIHAVTSHLILARPDFADRARGVMHALGPRGAIHLRAGRFPGSELYALAAALVAESAASGCWLVINDRLDVAVATGATAVQLTSQSLSVADARRIAPTLRIGASIHAVAEASAAERDGAAWIVAGHIFDTVSHPREPGKGTELLRRITSATAVPVIAIGGIHPEHIAALRKAGAHGVAAITGIWEAPDAAAAAARYLSRHDAADH